MPLQLEAIILFSKINYVNKGSISISFSKIPSNALIAKQKLDKAF